MYQLEGILFLGAPVITFPRLNVDPGCDKCRDEADLPAETNGHLADVWKRQ